MLKSTKLTFYFLHISCQNLNVKGLINSFTHLMCEKCILTLFFDFVLYFMHTHILHAKDNTPTEATNYACYTIFMRKFVKFICLKSMSYERTQHTCTFYKNIFKANRLTSSETLWLDSCEITANMCNSDLGCPLNYNLSKNRFQLTTVRQCAHFYF